MYCRLLEEAKYIKGIILLCLWMTFFNPQVVSAGCPSTPIEGVRLSSEVFEKDMERLRSYYEVSVVVTAYAIGDGHTPGSIMASGKEVYVGAVAYNDVPLGTRVVIDGVEYTVEDRVGSDGVIDIYMSTTEDCAIFGRKLMKVYVLERE